MGVGGTRGVRTSWEIQGTGSQRKSGTGGRGTTEKVEGEGEEKEETKRGLAHGRGRGRLHIQGALIVPATGLQRS